MSGETKGWVRIALAAVLATQACLGLFQVNEEWTRGHNGWNTSAYHQSAKNSLRFGLLFPLQYHTGLEEQPPSAVYTHHPLAMHLHNTAAMALFGDHRWVVRGVAALFGVLAAWALLFVVRRLYGDAHAILAGALYVLLPINAIFVNMANHVSGFIVFTLLGLYAYIRYHEARERPEGSGATRWLVALYAAQALAGFWDWPANYVALILATHWVVAGAGRVRRSRAALRSELASFAGFCAVVLATFFWHFALVALKTGGVYELLHVASARQGTGGFSWGHHLRTVPPLMFSWPILLLTTAWTLAFVVRLGRRRAALRDLVPFTFAVVGITHYVVFRQSAVVHEFWAWHTLPFVAIACASGLLAAGGFLVERIAPRISPAASSRRTARAIAAFALTFFMMPAVIHAARVIPDGRRVGGSMWFVAPVRGPEPFAYDSGRMELRFAELVRESIPRETGVLVDSRFFRIVPEPRWEITLDREVRRVRGAPRAAPRSGGAITGWVYVGITADLTAAERRRLLEAHPFTEFGEFFMADLREEGPRAQAFELVPEERSRWQRFFVSPFEPGVVTRPRRGD